MKNKKSQVTIFIIIALILVVLIALIFLLKSPPKMQAVDEKSPQQYIELCTKDAVNEALKEIRKNAGGVVSGFSVMNNGENYTYLCYTNENYKKCVNQRPKLVEYIEANITEYITPIINSCFESLQLNLRKKYDIEMGEMYVTTKLESMTVNVQINRDFKMAHGNDNREFKIFKISFPHPIYNLAAVATEIVNQEAQFCYFDNLGYMIVYPNYDIKRFKTGKSDTLYNIQERRSGIDFRFAIRNCIMPAGL